MIDDPCGEVTRHDGDAGRSSLTVHQVVAYNFARARRAAGWTQVEVSDRLEPLLGYRLNQAGVSAIECTFTSGRHRNIDAAEVVAYALCFGVPVGWFFLPPPSAVAAARIVPLRASHDERRDVITAVDLVGLVVGTAAGWTAMVDEIAVRVELVGSALRKALERALCDERKSQGWAEGVEARRRRLRTATLAAYACPGDEVITAMARLLVELVRLTPAGSAVLRDADPVAALELLARDGSPDDSGDGRVPTPW